MISGDRLMRSLEAIRQPAEQEGRLELAAEEGMNAHYEYITSMIK